MQNVENDPNAHYDATPVDAAEGWLDTTSVWPLRIMIAAFVCPIVIAFGGHMEFLFPWDTMGDDPLLVFVPLVTIGLLFASKFPSDVKTRAILCGSAALVTIAVISFQASWVIGALCLGAVCVAAGNRVAKQFTMQRAPAIVAGVGGAMILILSLWPVGGSSVVGALFSGDTWSSGGWMFCFAIVGVLIYAACGIGLAIPNIEKDRLQTTISLTARVTLGWMPACLIFGRMSVGPEIGMFDGGGITTMTVGFKVFGTAYPILVCAAVGVAAWLTAWMWDNLDESGPGGRPELPSMSSKEELARV